MTVTRFSALQVQAPAAPANRTDCHIHIYDARFASGMQTPPQATVSDYRLMQQRLGLSRVVIVQPRNYAMDNSAILDAIEQLGQDRARGVAVLHPGVSDAELQRLHDGGIRGLRFTVGKPDLAVVSVDMIEPLAQRIAGLGWHVQIHMRGAQIVEHESLLRRLPVSIVFDHMGRPPLPEGTAHRSHAIIRELIDRDRAWVKLSGAYYNRSADARDYHEANALARAFVEAAPERMLWGSDWPHPGEEVARDDAELLALLALQAPDASRQQRILVDNPAVLYGFPV
jgi:D-galactarolactone isomerase